MAKTKLISAALKTAMSQRETEKVSTLRLLLAALKNRQIELMRELTEAEEVAVLQQEVKKRQEAVELYEKGNRPELAEKEKREIQLIKAYLPAMMEEPEIIKFIESLKQKGELPADFGPAMKVIMAQVKGKADGKTVSAALKRVL